MRLRTKTNLVVAVAVLAYFTGPAGAQTTGGGGGGGGGDGSQGGSTVNFEQKSQGSPGAQLAAAESMVGAMQGTQHQINEAYQQAKATRDVVKALCVSAALNEIDTALQQAQSRISTMRANLTTTPPNTEAAAQDYLVIQQQQQTVNAKASDASQCVGEEASLTGDIEVRMEVDPTIPTEGDNTQFPPSDPNVVVQPPPCTSCTL